MRSFTLAAMLAVALVSTAAVAKLPARSDEAAAKAADTAAKATWTDKVGLYQICKAMDRVAAGYRASPAAKAASAPEPTPACTDPGPYVAQTTPAKDKPLEASEAHSPAGMATGPPSSKPTSAEMTGPRK
ncbi:MAG: hypothetical protein M3Z29_16815 [Pseudomonadota bacterium]|nr:hypothetical protein [Pseudomonadota bacterium]